MTNTTYKQTAIGLIPSDWEVKKFNKVAKFYSGGTPLTSKKEYYNGIIPFIKSGEIYFDRTEQFISEEGLSNSSAKMVKTGDLLYALYGANSGEIAICKISGAINQAILCIQTEIDKIFIYNFLLNEKQTIISKYLQGGQGNLSAEIIKNLQIPLPPLAEQQKIAAILSTWDMAIDDCKGIIEELKVRNKGLTQKLFNKEFEKKHLSEIFERVTTKNSEKNQNVITISAQRGFIKQTDFFNKIIASNILDHYTLVKKGDFCYNKSYSNGYDWGATKRLNDFEKAVVTTLYICFRLKDENQNSGDFFEYYFESEILYKGLSKVANEGGRAHGLLNVTSSDFFNIKIGVPTFEEQKAIATILDKATEELNQYQQKLQTLQLQKKGLMQQLLTGKVRVKI